MSDFDYNGLTRNHIQVIDRLLKKISANTTDNERFIGELYLQKHLLLNNKMLGKNAKSIRKEIEKTNEYKSIVTGGEDLVSYEKTKVQVCALTQKQIEDAWVSSCQHVFERTAALSYMKKGKVKCPVVGCEMIFKSSK